MSLKYIFAILICLTPSQIFAQQTGGPYLAWEDKYYTVSKGDYLYKIAKDHDVSFPFLQTVNLLEKRNYTIIQLYKYTIYTYVRHSRVDEYRQYSSMQGHLYSTQDHYTW